MEKRTKPIDFRQFWIKFRRPDGSLLASPVFDRDAFTMIFGDEAASAFLTFKDSRRKKVSSQGNEEMFQRAKITLEEKGINPDDVIGGMETDRIKDL